jgi:ABC-type polysaccharide/polyol phosphate transport system ATPase subunit
VIEILNVSKKFRIWEDRSRDLKETTINFLRGKKRSFRELWALRGINLEIKEGETVAFIGENGSGKSTLLKLLGGIYAPDEGRIVTRGKISTLLELGVGFHPDLTGEENVYLNGAMLGFDHAEMRERIDEIVSFSEIGNFIYSPIRTYSSGMLMRLGFSIATCVDPDILLVDEILAVGDEAFQSKCLTRMEKFKEERKTIILVSHSMELVQKLSQRVILLQEGRVVHDGPPEETIERYHTLLQKRDAPQEVPKVVEAVNIEVPIERPLSPSGEGKEAGERETKEEEGQERKAEAVGGIPEYKRYGALKAEIRDVIIRAETGEETGLFHTGALISFCLSIRFHNKVKDPTVGILIMQYDEGKMIEVYSTNTLWQKIRLGLFKKDKEVEVDFVQRIPLPEGEYYLTAAIADREASCFYDWRENLKSFRIIQERKDWKGKVNLNSQIHLTRSPRKRKPSS